MPRMQRITRAEMLLAARELAEEYGESLTLTAFRRETGWSQWAIFDLFGNWKNLRLAVGLTSMAPRVKCRVSKARIVELAREQAAKHGERLTEWTFRQETGLSGRVIQERFGSWGALRQLVGLGPRAKVARGYSDQELLDDLYNVFVRSGRKRPIYQQHRKRGGRFSAQTIRDRWGSWIAVRTAFELWRRRVERGGRPGSPG